MYDFYLSTSLYTFFLFFFYYYGCPTFQQIAYDHRYLPRKGGPDFKARLKMVAKSLMLYNVWYPEYKGFDIQKLAGEN